MDIDRHKLALDITIYVTGSITILFCCCVLLSVIILRLSIAFTDWRRERQRERQGRPGSLDFLKRDAYDILTNLNLIGRSGATLTHRRRLNAHPFHHRHILRGALARRRIAFDYSASSEELEALLVGWLDEQGWDWERHPWRA